MRHYDLCIIGSGPAGQKAAIQAAKLGRSVAVVERMETLGGVAINTGTIPSKALREAVLDVITGRRRFGSSAPSRLHGHANGTSNGNGSHGVGPSNILAAETIRQMGDACARVIKAEIDLVAEHFASNGVDTLHGLGSFVDGHTIQVQLEHAVEKVTADHVLIAVGTYPARPANIPFDGSTIFSSDDVLSLPRPPRSMIVVGGGVIGTEYASMLALLGVRVTLIEGRTRLLDFIDAEICEALQYHLRQAGVTLRLGEKVVKVEQVPDERPGGSASGGGDGGMLVQATLESGKTLKAGALMYCIGRQGATDRLNLNAANLKADSRGRIIVNSSYQTQVPHIYAAGDVIGFPALASTSMEQGRLAACHMFGERTDTIDELLPYGIYSIPELSMVGWTEERLTNEGIPFESGIAQYKETARGQLLGDNIGMLKILIHQDSHALLGAHALGTNATELIHIAQAVMAFRGTVEYFVNTVFNYPTLAECYKVAALNGLNKIRSM